MKVLDQSKDAGIRKSYHWVYYSPPDRLVMFDLHPLSEFQQIYASEHNAKIKGLYEDQLKEERQKSALPIFAHLKLWMESYRLKTTPSSPMGKAIDYFMNNWKRLTAYLHNGQTLIDNNHVERAIRVSAISKRNFLFYGAHEGGCWAGYDVLFLGHL